ncbi:MAG: RNA methyltransferase [Betaproteobacteria bacterium]|nr:RNA methyltransferase [Betaproteobacteria bacterium]
MTAPSPSDLLSRIRIVMVATSHPGNIGSAARAMKTMGLSDWILVAPKEADAVRHPQAIALSSGAQDVLDRARIVASLPEALAEVQLAIAFTARRRELSHGRYALREAAGRALQAAGQAFQAAGRALQTTESCPDSTQAAVALVFGNEAMGLSNEEVDLCQMIATVPTSPDYASLNVSQAIQLAAYEVMMAANAFVLPDEPLRPASSVGEVGGFLQHLQQAAVESGFLDPNSPKRFMTRMQRLFTRARLEPEEVAILRGLLSSFQKKSG